uniref:C2 domain-containing protein n=1 Tax=Macrostomum lignano TaxID=282301 RepID=A0A1I8GCR9_9PLAT
GSAGAAFLERRAAALATQNRKSKNSATRVNASKPVEGKRVVSAVESLVKPLFHDAVGAVLGRVPVYTPNVHASLTNKYKAAESVETPQFLFLNSRSHKNPRVQYTTLATKMADFSLNPPTPYLASPGEPSCPWPRWKSQFAIYSTATELDKTSEARQMAVLRHCLGPEGQRQAESVEANDMKKLLEELDKIFVPNKSVIGARYRFRCREQRPGEPVQQFVRDLQQLAADCAFKDLTKEMVRDQLIEKTCMPRIRERLLMEPDDLTLEKSLQLANQIETAINEAKVLNGTSGASQKTLLTLTLDSGASVSVISMSDFQRVRRHATKGSGTPARLVAYGGSHIRTYGTATLPITFKDKTASVCFQVAEGSSSLLGRSDFPKFGVSLQINHLGDEGSKPQDSFKDLFGPIRRAKGIVHRPKAYPLVTIRYVRGRDNTIADLLSRQQPNVQEDPQSNTDDQEIGRILMAQLAPAVNLDEVRQETASDKVLQAVSRFIKEGFCKAVRAVVAAYRATPTHVTGSSPHELMTGRPMRTPLLALQPDSEAKRPTSAHDRVATAKQRAKSDTDRRRHASATRTAVIQDGSWVHISKPVAPGKLEPKLAGPFRVRKRFKTTVLLENGKRWHLRRCVPAGPGKGSDDDGDAQLDEGGGGPEVDPPGPPDDLAGEPPAPLPVLRSNAPPELATMWSITLTEKLLLLILLRFCSSAEAALIVNSGFGLTCLEQGSSSPFVQVLIDGNAVCNTTVLSGKCSKEAAVWNSICGIDSWSALSFELIALHRFNATSAHLEIGRCSGVIGDGFHQCRLRLTNSSAYRGVLTYYWITNLPHMLYRVKVMEANNILGKDGSGSGSNSDAYVLAVSGACSAATVIQSTEKVSDSLNPVWDITLPQAYPAGDLLLEVFDHDGNYVPDYLGFCWTTLSPVNGSCWLSRQGGLNFTIHEAGNNTYTLKIVSAWDLEDTDSSSGPSDPFVLASSVGLFCGAISGIAPDSLHPRWNQTLNGLFAANASVNFTLSDRDGSSDQMIGSCTSLQQLSPGQHTCSISSGGNFTYLVEPAEIRAASWSNPGKCLRRQISACAHKSCLTDL